MGLKLILIKPQIRIKSLIQIICPWEQRLFQVFNSNLLIRIKSRVFNCIVADREGFDGNDVTVFSLSVRLPAFVGGDRRRVCV